MTTASLIGDSQAEGLLPYIQEHMEARGFAIIGAATHVGWKTGRFVREQPATALSRLGADVVLVVLGGNDIALTADSRAELASDIRQFLVQIRSSSSPHIIWIGPAHSTDPDTSRRHEGVAAVQRAILPALGVEWHDGEPMTDDLGHAADGVHFPRTSLMRWADRIDRSLFTNEHSTRWVGAVALLAAAAGVAGVVWVYWR